MYKLIHYLKFRGVDSNLDLYWLYPDSSKYKQGITNWESKWVDKTYKKRFILYLNYWIVKINYLREIQIQYLTLSAGWGCRIHWLHLCRGVKPSPNKCPGYVTKQSDGEVPVMLEHWGMRSTPSLLLLPGQLWSGVVAPDRALSMG